MRTVRFIVLLTACLVGFGADRADAMRCPMCYYPSICVRVISRVGEIRYYCVAPGAGVWLAPKAPYQSLIPETYTITITSSVDELGLAAVLNETTGWGVDVSGAGMTGPYPAGTYTGTVPEIANQLATAGHASVVVDQANTMLIFGLAVLE